MCPQLYTSIFFKVAARVRHDILLSKLQHNGIRGTAQNLFASFFSHRQQYVFLHNFSLTKYMLFVESHKAWFLNLFYLHYTLKTLLIVYLLHPDFLLMIFALSSNSKI